MSVTRVLVRMYPESFRDRWGSALEADAQSAGWRSWPSLLATVIDLWLHPVVWPAASASQRRYRAATMALTVTLTIWVVGRAAAASHSPLSQQYHPTWSLTNCAELMLLGMVLVLPLPRLTWHAVTTLLRRTFLALAAPAILGIGAIVFVHSVDPAVMSKSRLLVTSCYWLTLTLGAIQVSRIISSLDASVTVPPHPARLRLGIAVLAVGGALASWISLSSAVSTEGLDLLSAATGVCLLILTSIFFSTLRDLGNC
ncbi:hypothetical protein [Streptomyces sp. CB01881]|uniref:hypothetical protein n=1 Tax=Streptomyces sp. CB01881 TaxID=2078691 RepID=UPI000CDC9535|nr:hypothetical protein [Streptomyces sp. CB01881]AUY52506.1 hypothetical protein C2142_30360 [Streptomyces sp. CB01881]TYC70225.1 hypothetical protein EH183_30400 [Streptomyces sp. CB01881]